MLDLFDVTGAGSYMMGHIKVRIGSFNQTYLQDKWYLN